MLLPSAIPFDSCHQPRHAYSTSTPPPSSPRGFLSLSSCRALQAILGGRPTSPCPPSAPIGLQQQKTERLDAPAQSQKNRPPLRVITQNTKITRRERSPAQSILPVAQHRRTNKRSRSQFEEADENGAGGDQRCALDGTRKPLSFPDRDTFSTPKRQRRVPLLMPMGLSAQDFAGLDATPEVHPPPQPHQVKERIDLPGESEIASESLDQSAWSAADDRMLVSTVLDKLSLSCREWNDCARRLGREADSLGKRWKVLLGEEDAGLRRGSGGRTRPELSECWTRPDNV